MVQCKWRAQTVDASSRDSAHIRWRGCRATAAGTLLGQIGNKQAITSNQSGDLPQSCCSNAAPIKLKFERANGGIYSVLFISPYGREKGEQAGNKCANNSFGFKIKTASVYSRSLIKQQPVRIIKLYPLLIY